MNDDGRQNGSAQLSGPLIQARLSARLSRAELLLMCYLLCSPAELMCPPSKQSRAGGRRFGRITIAANYNNSSNNNDNKCAPN